MLLYYVRHGDPIYDPDSLTPLGLRQAEAVGKRLSVYGLDKIYTSSSTRAILTAKPTCEMLNLKPTVLDWCNESHAWRDLTVRRPDGNLTWLFHYPETLKLMASREVRALGDEWYNHPAFDSERYRQGIERIRRHTAEWMETLGYRMDREAHCYECIRPNDDRVALFAHQGFGLAFLSVLLDLPYPIIATHFDMQHTGVTVIHFHDCGGWAMPQVLQLSNDSHLVREGLPVAYNNSLRV